MGPSALGNDPEYQWTLRSSLNLAGAMSSMSPCGASRALPDPAVPAYTARRSALRLARDAATSTVSLVGRNLLDWRHAEFGAAPGRSEIRRSVLLHLRWEL